MLCTPNEGAAAVVLRATGASGSRGSGNGAGNGSRDGAVRLRSAVLRSHLPGSVLNESTPMSGLADASQSVPAPSAMAARAAYEEAGIGPADLDVVECQDTDAARELQSYEELGLCAAGGCVGLLADGATAVGGRLPVNTSGGLLSKGEPLGASALGQVVSLVRQLRGQAGAVQVEGARVALGHTVGRGANASVVMLSR
jgi:acetyl-CoA acetyltransferase